MTKEYFLTAYTGIENGCFIRSEKIKQINNLLNKLESENTIFSLQEIIAISNQLLISETVIRQPIFATVIFPILSEGAESGSVEAIKTLIKLAHPLQHYQNFTKNYQYSTRELVITGLKLAPNDFELLSSHEKDVRNYLYYTLHELPAGVLYDMNSSDNEGCDELLKLVVDYEQTCQKLGANHQELINKCRFYYVSYKDYLANRLSDPHLYKNFGEYLTKNGGYTEQD